MNLSVFSLKVAFARFSFNEWAARDLSHFRWLLNSRFLPLQKSLEQHRHPEIAPLSRGLGIPENAQAPLAKSSIRSKIRQVHL